MTVKRILVSSIGIKAYTVFFPPDDPSSFLRHDYLRFVANRFNPFTVTYTNACRITPLSIFATLFNSLVLPTLCAHIACYSFHHWAATKELCTQWQIPQRSYEIILASFLTANTIRVQTNRLFSSVSLTVHETQIYSIINNIFDRFTPVYTFDEMLSFFFSRSIVWSSIQVKFILSFHFSLKSDTYWRRFVK